MKYFKDLGVDPLLKDKLHQTCLYYTCREGKYNTSKFLIEECHLPVNEKDVYGQTPIYYAASTGNIKTNPNRNCMSHSNSFLTSNKARINTYSGISGYHPKNKISLLTQMNKMKIKTKNDEKKVVPLWNNKIFNQ